MNLLYTLYHDWHECTHPNHFALTQNGPILAQRYTTIASDSGTVIFCLCLLKTPKLAN